MSGTRHAAAGAEPSDERFASSPLLVRGLKAGDVTRRCETLSRPQDVELALFLQYVSWESGGLEKLAAELLAAFPANLGSPSMHRHGIRAGKFYDAKAVEAIRGDAPFFAGDFPLKGEVESSMEDVLEDTPSRRAHLETRNRAGQRHPSSYRAEVFLDQCRVSFLETCPDLVRNFCLDPAFSPDGLDHPAFRDLRPALLEYMDRWEKERLERLVITEVGRKVIEALDYAESQRCLALVEGFARTGKSYVAKAWCIARPGRRRYLSLTESTSDKEFFREIAKALRAASSYGFKGNELRERVNDILQLGHLSLVIDEAHFLWPTRNVREATPRRIEWVRTSLANHDVPVVMIATHQFTRAQQQIEKHTNWSSEQLVGRIAFCAKLPDRLEPKDIEAVARFHLPEAEPRSIKFLVDYVVASKKHLASIEHGVKAARHQAARAGRSKVTYADIMLGFNNTVLPSDRALAPQPVKTRFPASLNPTADRLQGQGTPHTSRSIKSSPDRDSAMV